MPFIVLLACRSATGIGCRGHRPEADSAGGEEIKMGKVERFYDQNPEYEWERLERHRTEFAVTMRAFEDYLPKPPARILDVGGGPGRYAIALTQRGYEVTLFDLSRGCLDLAREKAEEAGAKLAGYEHGDAQDLSRFQDESFDAVLLLGPLYHLLEEGERRLAIREARRVLRRCEKCPFKSAL